MLSFAGCPGLVPGWRAFLATQRLPLPTPPPVPFSPQPEHGWGEKGRVEGCALQIGSCSCIPCATPAQDRGSLKYANRVLRQDGVSNSRNNETLSP